MGKFRPLFVDQQKEDRRKKNETHLLELVKSLVELLNFQDAGFNGVVERLNSLVVVAEVPQVGELKWHKHRKIRCDGWLGRCGLQARYLLLQCT